MRKSLLFFICILFVSLLLVGSVAGATQTLTVVRDGNNILPLSDDTGTYGEVGDMYVLVTDFNKVYYYHHSEIASEQDLSSSVEDYSSRFETVVQYEYGEVTQENVGAYVELNIKNTYILKEEIHYDYQNINGQNVLIGTNTGTGGILGQMVITSDNKFRTWWVSNTINTNANQYYGDHIIIFNNQPNNLYLDGVSQTLSSDSGNFNNNHLYLFKGDVLGTQYQGIGKIYNVKIDTTQNEHRDVYFVTTDSTVRALDKANWNFLTTSGVINVGGTSQTLTFQHELPSTPSISAISVTSSSPAPVGSTVNVNVSVANIDRSSITLQLFTRRDSTSWYDVGNRVPVSEGATSVIATFTGGNTADLYYIKAILFDGDTDIYDSYLWGIPNGEVKLVTIPTLSDISISQSIGKLQTAYTPTITIPITGLGGAETVYLKAQENVNNVWTDISGVSGTATETGSKTLTLSVNDNTATTHQYRVLVSSLSDYTASVTATSNTVTFSTFAPPATPTAEINPSTITINTQTSITLNATSYPTAPAGNTYYYQWKYGDSSTPSAGDTNITQAETTLTNPATWNVNFPSTGTKYVYLQITDSLSQTKYSQSQTLTITNIQASVVWATTYHGMSDNINLVINGHQLGNSYTWYYQDTTGTEWTQIGTTYSYNYVKTPTQMGLTSGHTYRFKAVFNGVDLTATNTITPYADPTVSAPTASSSSVAIPGTSTLTAHVSDASLVSSYQWQKYQSSTWTSISGATGSAYAASITTAGNNQFRVVVTGLSGHITESATVTVYGGVAPTVTITSPTNGQKFTTKGVKINLTATATGEGNSYVWEISDTNGIEHGDLTSLNSWVKFKYSGDKQIRITATNAYGVSSYTVTINYYDPTARPMASATLAPVSTSAVTNLTDVVNVAPGTYPSVKDTVKAVFAPIDEVMPTGFIFVLVFGVIFLMLWLITKNTAVPSIIGLIFGVFLLALFPASYYGPAIIILAISIAGGVYRVFRPPQ